MTEQYRSEEGLFSTEEGSVLTVSPPKTKTQKRVSVRGGFPIMVSSGDESSDSSRPASMSTDQGTTAGPAVSTPRQSTTIGTTSGNGNRLDGVTLSITRNDGTVMQSNIWSDVIAGTNAVMLHRFITAISQTDTFDAHGFINNIQYQGFDREYYIKAALKKVSISIFLRFAILGAVRGSNFKKITDTCLDMPQDLQNIYSTGIIVKKASKKDELTILRFTASVPQWCAYYMHSASIEKKIPNEECPGWLQFPGAASLPMSEDLRKQHIKFSISFSKLLPGGSFSETIYLTAYNNMIPMAEIPQALMLQMGVRNLADARTMDNAAISRYAAALSSGR